MATKTWTHGGTPATTLNLGFSGTTAPPNWLAAIDAWVATNNENGDSGTVNVASAPGSVGMFVNLQDDGGIVPTTVIDTVRITFNYAVTNGPMGGGVATSNFDTSVPTPLPIGVGANSGTYDQVDTALNVLGSTDPAVLFANPLGLIYSMAQTGVFAAHNRRLSISSFSVTVTYTPPFTPAVIRVNPPTGSVNGGQAVKITGIGFTAATGVTFGGTAVTSYVIVNDLVITAVTPEHASGLVDVEVLSVAIGTDLYTFVIPPSFRLDPLPERTPIQQGGIGARRGR